MKKLLSLIAIAAIMTVCSFDAKAQVDPPYYDSTTEFDGLLGFYINAVLGGPGTPEAIQLMEEFGSKLGAGAGVGFNVPSDIEIGGETATLIAVITLSRDNGFDGLSDTEVDKFVKYLGDINVSITGTDPITGNPIGTLDPGESFASGTGSAGFVSTVGVDTDPNAFLQQIEVYSTDPDAIPGVPIDGGLSFLALGGIAYGIRRFRKNA